MTLAAVAQDSSRPASPTPSAKIEKPSEILLKRLPQNILLDQKRIWTAPVRLRARDLDWLVPAAVGTALVIASDQSIQAHLPTSKTTISHGSTFSNAGAVAFAGGAAGLYLLGVYKGNDHLRSTGLLSGEAAIDAYLVSELMKGMTRRERPSEGSGRGRFGDSASPWQSSFPSQHSTAAFAIATVVAHQYPGILTKIVAYGGASAIGAARIIGHDHFTSDVLVGSAVGYYVGHQVLAEHVEKDAEYGTFVRAESNDKDPARMATPYVPLDSWVYEAFDRLRGLGYVKSAMMGMRPWTRMECARLTQEFEDVDDDDDTTPVEAKSLLRSLNQEFRRESRLLDGGGSNVAAHLESVYTRFTGISGMPVNDPLHSGQTIVNDFGRPYAQGLNAVTGLTADAEAGPFAFYLRGEYQHSPSFAAVPLSARTAYAASDQLPVQPGTPFAAVDRLRILEGYVALNLSDWQVSFGKQNSWWGPGTGGDLMMSNNAEGLWSLKLSRVTPLKLPSVFKYLGPIRTESMLGQIRGYHFLKVGPTLTLVGDWNSYVDPQPFMWGQKFSFKPTKNLELGFSYTTVFAGFGRPMNLRTFRHTFSLHGNAQSLEPGDRRTGFDFSYRLPGVRNWLTLYNGSMAEDEPNPIAYPRRSAMNPGLYLTHVPKIPKLDLRVEAVYTDLPNLGIPGVFYRNSRYVGGYTNYGGEMGSWIGPEARGIQAISRYWFSGRNKLEVGFRQEKMNKEYLQGGDLHDFSLVYNVLLKHGLEVKTGFQYERWNFPLLAAQPNSNQVLSVQLTYHSKLRKSREAAPAP